MPRARKDNGRAFGRAREDKVKEFLEAHGWVVVKASGSHGEIDLLARASRRITFHPAHISEPMQLASITYAGDKRDTLFIEVKATVNGPYAAFPPADRQALRAVAERAGADAWLAWWPPRGDLTWIGSSDWPPARQRSGRSVMA